MVKKMPKKSSYLTGSEEELMELFWTKQEPLTSVEILKVAEGHSWNDSYLHIMLRSLLKKGLIEVCGTVQYGTQYARQFIPSVTKEGYAAKLIISKGLGKNSISKVAVAMVNELDGSTTKSVIKDLEKIIDELKK